MCLSEKKINPAYQFTLFKYFYEAMWNKTYIIIYLHIYFTIIIIYYCIFIYILVF